MKIRSRPKSIPILFLLKFSHLSKNRHEINPIFYSIFAWARIFSLEQKWIWRQGIFLLVDITTLIFSFKFIAQNCILTKIYKIQHNTSLLKIWLVFSLNSCVNIYIYIHSEFLNKIHSNPNSNNQYSFLFSLHTIHNIIKSYSKTSSTPKSTYKLPNHQNLLFLYFQNQINQSTLLNKKLWSLWPLRSEL